MNQKPIIFTLATILFLLIGLIFYKKYISTNVKDVWSLIPKNAVMVYEFGECEKCKEELSNTVIANILKELFIPSTDSISQKLDFLFSNGTGKKISIHSIGKNSFDIIFYFDQQELGLARERLDSFRSGRNVKYAERTLNDVVIKEFDFGSSAFSWTEVNDVGIGSFASVLIEDVIRLNSSDDEIRFIDLVKSVYHLPKVNNDLGNIYLHFPNFGKEVKAFDTKVFLNELASSGLFDVKVNNGTITINGFTRVDKEGSDKLLSYFEGQSPVAFNLKHLISNRVASVYSFGMSDPNLLFDKLIKGERKYSFDSLQQLFKLDLKQLLANMAGEFAQCDVEGKGGFDKILLANVNDKKIWNDILSNVSLLSESEDTVFYERFSEYEIREIEVRNFTEIIFGRLVEGFETSYYTSLGNTFIFSNDLEQLKNYLSDIDREEVWGKSVSYNKFLESTLLESNVSIFFNTPLALEKLKASTNPAGAKFLLSHLQQFKSFGLGSIQFSYLNDSFYTNAVLNFKNLNDKVKNPVVSRVVVSTPHRIINGPFIVKNHLDRQDEIILQDSLNTIYLISTDGKILWSKKLDSEITNKVKQVDFYKNGKLQYFITTKKQLHVVDRLGNDVKPFPSPSFLNEIEFNSVVDYDNSKKYRFLIADRSGKLWMFDKELVNLDGWKPKNIEDGLITEMNHHRIRGKDFIIAIRKDGLVYLMNRRGELEKNFPLNLEARPEGDYFLEIGNSLSESHFICVSRDGHKIKFNPLGKIISRETLIKPSLTTQFSLVREASGKSYIIKRQDAKSLVLLSTDGKEIVINSYCATNPTQVQYVDYGGGRKFYIITDLSQELSFLYDGNGVEITKTPISGGLISISNGKTEKPITFSVSENTLIIEK